MKFEGLKLSHREKKIYWIGIITGVVVGFMFLFSLLMFDSVFALESSASPNVIASELLKIIQDYYSPTCPVVANLTSTPVAIQVSQIGNSVNFTVANLTIGLNFSVNSSESFQVILNLSSYPSVSEGFDSGFVKKIVDDCLVVTEKCQADVRQKESYITTEVVGLERELSEQKIALTSAFAQNVSLLQQRNDNLLSRAQVSEQQRDIMVVLLIVLSVVWAGLQFYNWISDYRSGHDISQVRDAGELKKKTTPKTTKKKSPGGKGK